VESAHGRASTRDVHNDAGMDRRVDDTWLNSVLDVGRLFLAMASQGEWRRLGQGFPSSRRVTASS